MPEADVTNKAREREQVPRETVRRIPQATTTDGNRQPTPVAVLLFRIGDVFLLISSVVNILLVSGYRTLVPMALRGHGAGAGCCSQVSLPSARGKTLCHHRFRGLLPFCQCRLASRQKGRRAKSGLTAVLPRRSPRCTPRPAPHPLALNAESRQSWDGVGRAPPAAEGCRGWTKPCGALWREARSRPGRT